MCGIAGWVSFERDLRAEAPVLQRMTATMRRRGPDGSGVWIGEHAGLGHHRLAVIDLAGGAQPMSADQPDGTVILVYSGEVYNFAELRDELRRCGHEFGTASDTEVVLRGFLQWGDGVAERLNGMYAFAVWDGRRDRLSLIRDRLGIKPLYVHRTRDGVLFGSEPKAILENPIAPAIVDLAGMRALLAYNLTVPGTAWRGLEEVRPGSVVSVDRRGLRSRTYWELESRPHDGERSGTLRRVRELLADIVGRQLVADVPIGVLLSGGLDSTTLAALSAEHLARQRNAVRTYAVDFPGHADRFVPDSERPAADTPFVNEVVAHIGAAHTRVLLDPARLAAPDLRRRVVDAYDVPPGSGDRDRSMYLLFAAIRERATVALSGESADELFGGYGWFHDPTVQRAAMFPWVTACGELYSPLPDAFVPDVYAAIDLHAHLRDEYATAVSAIGAVPGEGPQERRMRRVCHLHLTRQLRVLLDRKDRISMAVGLEVRVPYCDHRLVEYVYNTPWALKTFDGREKSLLRGAARDVVPQSVAERVKSAYPSIRDPAHDAALVQQVRELSVAGSHPVFEVASRRWLQRAARGDPTTLRADMRNTFEWLLNLATWLELRRPRLQLT